jgi:lipopolysaccharide export system protein LptA
MIRVKLLSAGRLAALGLFIAIASALVIYLVIRNKRVEAPQDRPKLQGRVVAVFNNTHYAHEVEGRLRFVMTAGVDKTYENGAHELEQVKLESYGADGSRHDIVTSDSAKISDPSDLDKLDAEFIANVVVQTTDGLNIKTEYLHYDHVKNTVDTDKPVEFEGRNFAGRCIGALVEATDERAHLLKAVDVTIKPEDESKANADKRKNETDTEKAARKAARKARKRARKLERQRAAANLAQSDSASGASDKTGAGKTRAGKTSASKTGANSKTKSRGGAQSGGAQSGGAQSGAPQIASKKPTRIRSQSALLEKKDHRVTFDGSVVITQEADEMRADKMIGFTDQTNHLERVEARGNSHLTQAEKAEIKSPDMDFFFGATHQIERAVAMGGAYTQSLGAEARREAKAATIEATFVAADRSSAVDVIKATGEALVQIHPAKPANGQINPTERELAANNVLLHFFPDGKNIRAAEASENAVMTVTPVRAERGADKKTIRAPQMNSTFYDEGNRVKTFNATGGVKVEILATMAEAHPPRITSSDHLDAQFLADSQDIDRVSQEGNFKYNEGDRNALAERAIYDGQKEVLNLRGKRPQAWDAKSRTQADEIDYDRQKDESHARGDVRTTYYSRETAGESTPFKNTKSPVFMTAERADARNGEGVAVYTVNARGWQDDNFVKADRIELYQNDKRMAAFGNVESALYQIKQTADGKREQVPGFATSERMNYSDIDRLVHYEGNVKARQGTDRIEASTVDVYLQKETNEVDRMNADGNVALTQPGRRGTGDHMVYTSSDDRAILTGKTARVDDSEKGSTMGARLTFYRRDDKISVENQQGAGRVKSTHRLTKSKEN